MTELTQSEPRHPSVVGDVDQNTAMLFELPELAQEIAPQVGNAIVIPKGPEDVDEPWRTLLMDFDGKPAIIFTTKANKPRSLKPTPALSFTPTGLNKIFEYGEPPKDFILMLADHLRHQADLGHEHEAWKGISYVS